MKKLLCLLILLLPFGLTSAQGYQEGVHYERVAPADDRDPNAPITVEEYFWYGCPHCYTLEPSITQWLETKPDNVTFARIPAPLNSRWAVHARAYFVAEVLGKADDIHQPLFDAMHVQRRQIMSKDELAAFFSDYGISEEEFNKVWDSFAVQNKMQKALNDARRYRLTGVPSVVINGEYVTSMATSGGRVFEVVNYLVAGINASRGESETAAAQ